MAVERQKIQIFGQRCSGTNYLEKLLVANFKNIQIVSTYGFKHIWNAQLSVPINPEDNIKIIIIVRDPYDWIRSVHREPHHCAQLLGLSINDFVKAPWRAYHSADWNNYDRKIRMKTIVEEKIIENFNNVIDCRNQKMQLFNSLKKGNQANTIIKYEELRDDPEGTLQFIQKTSEIECNSNFTPIYSYKDSGKNFKKKKYIRLSSSVVKFINEQIDWSNEELFGYMKRDRVEGSNLDYHRIQFLIKQWYYENLA